MRMNLQTGLKEAKLMDGDDGVKYWKEGEREGQSELYESRVILIIPCSYLK